MPSTRNLRTARKYRDCGILVVEDDPVCRMILLHVLHLRGYRHILEAEDGDEALRILAADPEKIHVILLDIGLPRLNGLEVLRHLTISHPVTVAVIAVTGYAMREDRRRFSERGSISVLAFRYLTKPVELKVLSRVLREALRTIVESRGAGQGLLS
jgi:CheY-like chemotaxis protein